MKDYKYSVVVPVYDSSDTLDELCHRISTVFKEITENYELILIDDSSNDNSWEKMEELKKNYSYLRIIQLTRNFGQHNAIMCGFNFTQGEYVITLDDDLQTPPEEIPKLISKMKEGYDVVYGVYSKKRHSLFRNIGSGIVRFVYKVIFKTNIDITSFRIIHKSIMDAIKEYNMNYTYIDGLIAWNTDKIGAITVSHTERKKGVSGYTLAKLTALGMSVLTNFSISPLQITSFLGILFSLAGFCMAIVFFILRFIINVPVPGFTAIIITVTFFAGVQLMGLGIMGEYIGRVHLNINKRPQYRIRKAIM